MYGQSVVNLPLSSHPHAHTGKAEVSPGVRATIANEIKKPRDDTPGGSGGCAMRLLSLSLLIKFLSLEPHYQGEFVVTKKTLSKGLTGTHHIPIKIMP